MSRTVAIVGRPNVGKSRLFNRLARKRISIVHDQPGVTRDVISTEISEGAFTLLDTGGLGLVGGESTVDLIKASEKQVDFAIASADLILFVIDGLEGELRIDLVAEHEQIFFPAKRCDRFQLYPVAGATRRIAG